MRALKFFFLLLIVEGLVLTALRFYWGATLPEDARLRFVGYTWTRDEGLRLTEQIGAWSCIAGSAGWMLTNIALHLKKRRPEPPEEDE